MGEYGWEVTKTFSKGFVEAYDSWPLGSSCEYYVDNETVASFMEGKAAPEVQAFRSTYYQALNRLAGQYVIGFGLRIPNEAMVKWVL